MMANSVIFIGSPEKNTKLTRVQTVKQLFRVSPGDLLFRIFASFVPPFGENYRKVHVDLQGPLLAVILLAAFVNYGHSFKATSPWKSPTEAVVAFSAVMPILCFLLCRLGHSCMTLWEITSLIGYSLYGHLFTLFVSFLFFQERSNSFFFVCLALFGGMSTLRVALVFLKTIALPAARLLICTAISVVNVLFLIFLHFGYMHRTFVYRGHGIK